MPKDNAMQTRFGPRAEHRAREHHERRVLSLALASLAKVRRDQTEAWQCRVPSGVKSDRAEMPAKC